MNQEQQGINTAQLLVKHLRGELGEADTQQLEFMLANDAAMRQILSEMQDEKKLQTDLRVFEEIDIENRWKKFNPNKKMPVIGNTRIWWYAAAIMLVFSAAAYLWINNASSTKSELVEAPPATRYKNDVLPGGNKAILTLADGSQIILDSAQNGMLIQQGNTNIIKLKSGQLAYENKLNKTKNEAEVLYNTISTPRGGEYQITLPDGSRVWLNSASSLSFPASFKGDERIVKITGEAYFEIEKNEKMPFVVQANGTEVRVLGTSFNINAYADENAVKTTLLNGSVLVTPRAGVKKDEVLLEPGEQVAVTTDATTKVHMADTDEATAWKNGLFQFNEANIEVIMRQLSRWYKVDVVFKGAIPQGSFRGKISKKVNISQVLRILEFSDVHFDIDGNRITVMP